MKRLFAAAVLATVVCIAAPARADIVLGVGLSGNAGGGDTVDVPSSWGAQGLLGYRLSLGPIEVTPELELNYLQSLDSLRNDQVDWAFDVMGGGRAGLALGGWVPSVYAHVGLGHVRLQSGLVTRSETGPAVEVGGALDYRLLDLLSLGVQAGYVGVQVEDLATGDESLSWLRVGAHATISF